MGVKWEVDIDGNPTGGDAIFDTVTADDITVNNTPTNPAHAARKDYVDSLFQGVDWQESVLSRYDPSIVLPPGPNDGDRHISIATANGWTLDYIYEYDLATTAWVETIPNTGFATFVEAELIQYIFNGAAWVTLSSTTNHNVLSSLQGGSGALVEYYHLDNTEHAWLSAHVSSDGSQHTFLNQNVTTAASPEFAGLTLTGLGGILSASAGIVSASLTPTVTSMTINNAPTADTDAVRKSYVDALVRGAEWQDSVTSRYDPTAATPPGPAGGDRYIATATANGWTDNYIYEYDGVSAWVETVVEEGFACWVDTEDKTVIFNGTDWVIMAGGGSIGIGYTHTQSGASVTWTIVHNLGYKYVNIDCYDSSDEIIIPDSIVATDVNTTTVTFATSRTGAAVISAPTVKSEPNSYLHTQSGASATWTVTHNLSSQYVSVICYDSADDVIIPDNIEATDANTITVTLSSAIVGKVRVFAAGGGQSIYSASEMVADTNNNGIYLNSSLRFKYTSTAISYNILLTDYFIGITDVTANRDIQLPSAAAVVTGRVFEIKDETINAATGGNTIKLITEGAETIDGAADQTFGDGTHYKVYSNGTNWFKC